MILALIIIIIIIIISACPVLAEERYIKRDARVCTQLHFNVCKETGVNLDNEHWCEHVPKLVETIRDGKVLLLLYIKVYYYYYIKVLLYILYYIHIVYNIYIYIYIYIY